MNIKFDEMKKLTESLVSQTNNSIERMEDSYQNDNDDIYNASVMSQGVGIRLHRQNDISDTETTENG